MNTKEFTLLQLFSIIDGRLSTNIGDVYDMLNHITGNDLMTHHLPVAMDYIKKVNPKWFSELKITLLNLGITRELAFEDCVNIINSHNNLFSVPQLTKEEAKGFTDFMIENSLLSKK